MSSAQRPRLVRFWTGPAGAALICVLAAGAAQAQDHGVVFAGADSGSDRSAYAGMTLALPGSTFGHGWGVRAIVSGSEYSYDGGPGLIKGRETGIDLAAAYQWSGDWGYANLAAGPRYHDTRLSPADPGNRNHGARWDGVVAADGGRNLGAWKVTGFGSYGVTLREYYARGEITRAVFGPVRLGAEAVAQGDQYYNRQLYGPVLAITPSPKWELRVSGGVEHQQGRDGAYAGLFVSRVF